MKFNNPHAVTRIHTSVVLAVIYIWEIKHLLELLFSGK
jgi:hypothetical protein